MPDRPLHIGIVGCSAEGAALCYKTICTESPKLLGDHAHPEVSMHTPSFADYVACLDADDLPGVGDLMLSSARKLKAISADFLICPDNTIHAAFGYVKERSPLPWLHIAEVVVEEAELRGLRHLGILGTKWLVESEVYPEKLAARGLTWKRPSKDEIHEISRIIMEELVYGVLRAESVDSFRHIIDHLKDDGCDGVILGCTEIPLIIDDSRSSLPTLDSTRLLARAAIKAAVEHTIPL